MRTNHSIAALISLWFMAPGVLADPIPSEIEAQGIELMQSGEYQQAEEVFEKLVEMRPESFVGHYNLAAAHSMQGEIEEAITSMSEAIRIGFSDIAQLRRDPDLVSLRADEWFAELNRQWGELIKARRESDIARIEGLIRKGIERRSDETLRVELRSAHDPLATDEAMAEIEMIAKWATGEIFTDLPRQDLSEQPWIMIALPDRAGFGMWATSVFGPSVRGSISSVGGAYEHQQRRLVAQDLGATLRHEFVHVLHWRDMNRLGQAHAPWVQEGLASLIEDYDLRGGTPDPVPSWRTNIVKRLLDVGRLPSIETLSRIEMNAFTAKRPLAQYAQARTLMLWLLETNKLRAFYQHYCKHYSEDPSGYQSLLAATGTEPESLEKQYRDWVRALPSVPETGSDLQATLGIEIENGTGDGVLVKGLQGDARRRTGLRLNAVITHINDQPTRDLFEFIRVIGQYQPGQRVTLRWRRGSVHSTSEATLIAGD